MQATNFTHLFTHASADGVEPGPDGLPWHWGARPSSIPSRRTPIAVEGLRGELALEHGDLLRRDRLLVDGRPAPRIEGGHGHRLRRTDGTAVEAYLRPTFTRTLPDLVVDGRAVPLGEALPGHALALVFLPLLLGLAFGAVGAVVGGLAVLFNRSLARQQLGRGLESVALLSSFAGATALTVVVTVLLRVLAAAG